MRDWVRSLVPRTAGEPAFAASSELRTWAERHIGPAAAVWAAELTATVMSSLSSGTPGRTGLDAARGCEECLLTTLVGLVHDTASTEIQTPDAAIDDARVAARLDIPLAQLLQIVWACHAAVQETFTRIIGDTTPADALLVEILAMNSVLARFVDRYVADISAAYSAERLESESRLLAERRRIVDEVMAGGTLGDEAERRLGIRAEHVHVAAMAWRPLGMRRIGGENAVHRFAERVARSARASGRLLVEREEHVELHWSFPSLELDIRAWSEAAPPGMHLAVGLVGAGVAGFRSTTAAARRAFDIARRATDLGPVIYYEDVALLALLSADMAHARDFVQRELAGLLDEDPLSSAVRDSLRLFLRHGRSRQAVAAVQHVAATTVAYRVRKAEVRLGRSSEVRPWETLVALDLLRSFPEIGGSAGQPPG